MLRDFLQDSWTFQETLAEGREQGLEQGLTQGLEQGRVEEARRSIERFVEKRFPASLAWVKTRVKQIDDLKILEEVMSMLFMTNAEEEVATAFSASHN